MTSIRCLTVSRANHPKHRGLLTRRIDNGILNLNFDAYLKEMRRKAAPKGVFRLRPRHRAMSARVMERLVEQMLEAEAAVASARRLHRATLEIRDGYANDRSRPGTAYRSSDERSRRRAGQAHHTAGAASDVLLCVHNRVCRKIWGRSCTGSHVGNTLSTLANNCLNPPINTILFHEFRSTVILYHTSAHRLSMSIDLQHTEQSYFQR